MTDPNTPTVTDVPRCTFAHLGTVADDTPADLLAAVNTYFAQFQPPIVPKTANLMTGARCACGAVLTGLLGSFTYGLAHGEGRCGTCGYPGRADHYVPGPDGETVIELHQFVLLYHPDVLREVPA